MIAAYSGRISSNFSTGIEAHVGRAMLTATSHPERVTLRSHLAHLRPPQPAHRRVPVLRLSRGQPTRL